MIGSEKIRSNGCGKVLGSTGRPWGNNARDTRINMIKSGHYHKVIYLIRIRKVRQFDE